MSQSLTIYKASAGSGKTFTLAVEYIMGLLQEGAEREFEKTLAVTFTNKATAEMKNRILETLYGLKMGLEDAKSYMKAIMDRFKDAKIPITEEQVRLQAGKALTAILHDYSRFRVETIDSFFQSILRNMARELGLAANLQVEISHDEVIGSAVDSLIETMDQQPEVAKWVLDYVREQLDSGDRWDIVKPLKSFAKNIFEEEYQQRSAEELAKISNADIVKDFKGKMQAIKKKAEKEIQEGTDRLLQELPNNPIYDKISRVGDIESFLENMRDQYKEPSDSIQKKINGDESFLKKAFVDSASLAEEETFRQTLQQLVGYLKDYFSATLALHRLSLLRLLEYIDEKAREIEGDAGRFTLSSTPALLSKMIEGSDAPFIFEKIGTFINNVMIDEFQDTSRMQWNNFKKLLFEKLASGGKGLLVGDIKQSIYRWRNGDWKILYGIEKEPDLQRFNIKPEPLDTNFRSYGVIVDFNNAFFPVAAKLLDTIEPDADIKLDTIYEDVKQQKDKEEGLGLVRIKIYKGNAEDNAILDMVEQVKRLQAEGLEPGKIAILIRKNKFAQPIIEGFSQYAPDIPIVSDEAFMLGASISVQMIVAAMRMLIDKNHKDGISEKYLMLHYLRDVLGKRNTTIQTVALQKADQVLPEEFTKQREELLQLPLYLLAEKLWRIFSLNNIEGEDIYTLTFFDELQKHLRSAIAPDIQTFLTAWDENLYKCSVPGSSVPGVRILTIHKSKGLAFHTVLLPFSQWGIESGEQSDMLWCETDQAPYNELGALPIPIYAKDVRTSVFAPAYEREHLERRVDALNMLYVAFTRAKCNLYVWGKTKTENKKGDISISGAGELIYLSLRNKENDTNEECFDYEVGTPLIKPKKEEEKENRLRIEHRMEDAVEVKVVTRNPMLYFQQSNQTEDYLQQMKEEGQEVMPLRLSQREIGKRMHEVLSLINDVGELEEVLNKAREEGLIGEGEDWETITSRIREGFGNPLVASWFSKENIVYNECGIAGIDKETGRPQVLRPDRVVMNGNDITVIDYKFGHPSRLYYDQVKDYMKLMKQMYPQRNVQGYLWYIMGKGPMPVKSEQ
ncbi:MAG: UvrD-helicase domain-containing protein [Bacteroidaceae bacterium]|nr:UvrD-helicase domain-containing protein [Bacteroidaceae bacterium]